MILKKRNGFNLEPILKQLSASRTMIKPGSTSSSAFGAMDEFESYLKTAMYAEGKTGAFVGRVVKAAMSAEQELDEKKFIKHANSIANRLDKTTRGPKKVVFPVWGGKGLFGGRRRWGGVWISFDVSSQSQFVRRAQRGRSEQIKKHGQGTVLTVNDFSDLPLAVCNVQAIDAFDAFELAESAISIELGLHSLMESRGQILFSNLLGEKPISQILLAPHMTVHEPSGSLSNDVLWYNHWPNRQTEIHRTQEKIGKIQKNVEHVRERMRRLPPIWRKEAELALARHYGAFSQSDLNASFLDGWRLLESIGGHPREKSETLVRRAAWFFEVPEERYQFGLHLMHRRHLISHGRPVRADDKEGLAFQMKEFLTPMLLGCLTNPFNFKDIKEFWDFCDLPTDRDIRNQRRHILECGAKFRCES